MNQFKTLVERAVDGFLVLDDEGTVLYANPSAAAMLSRSIDELLGFQFGFPAATDKPVEISMPRADGKRSTFELRATQIVWDNRLVTLASLRDITDFKKTVEALQRSEMQHREAQKVAHIGHWKLIPEIGTPEWSEEIFHIFGLNPDQGAPSFAEHENFIHPDDWHQLDIFMRRACNEGIPYDIEFRFLHPEKGTRWMHAVATVDLDVDGKVREIFGTAQDITDVKQMFEELRESRKLLHNITENMLDMVTMSDMEGRRIYVSPSHQAILGYSPEFLLGREIMEFVHPDDMNIILRKMNEGRNTFKEQKAIFRHQKSDGGYIWLETLGKLLRDEKKNPSGMIFSTRDITKRKEVEDELERALAAARSKAAEMEHLLSGARLILEGEEFNRIVKSIFSGLKEMTGARAGYVALLSQDSKMNEVVYMDSGDLPCSVEPDLPMPIRGLRGEAHMTRSVVYENDFMNSGWADLLPPGHADLKNVMFVPLNIEEETFGIIGLANKPVDFTDYDLHLAGSFGQLASIALKNKLAAEEQDRLQAQLYQSQKLESIGRLAGGVAHDFNNLLTAIQGFADLIRQSLSRQDPMLKDVEEIQKAAQSASVLIGQLLAFSRKQIVTPRVLNLNSVINRSESMLCRIIGEDIELQFIGDPDPGQVEIDPNQVDQILVNLAVNARDAMPDGGRLTIETQNVKLAGEYAFIPRENIGREFVLLAVSDTGVGIAPEIKPNIFEPFFTTKSHGKGTGLGLSTVYGIVKQNKGYINVYSEPGHGTTFKIYLPRINAEVDEHEEIREIRDFSGSETILLVEDQGVVRKTAAKILKARGYKLITAANGGEALIRFEQAEENIDLLLTDVVMPHMSGSELYAKIAEHKPELKVLYMSGYTENTIAHHNILDRGINFIQKPFRPDDLLCKVRLVLDGTGDTVKKERVTVEEEAGTEDREVASGPVSDTAAGAEQKFSRSDVVLIIDDEEQFHLLLERYAQEADICVLSALDGEEGLKLLRDRGDSISLVISDFNLPDFDGVHLVERILEARDDIPIILVSGYFPDDINEQRFTEGCVVCRQKPINDIDKWFVGLVKEYSLKNTR